MRSLLLAVATLSAPLAHAGNVHIVGGPASTAPTIQAAVDAAVDGDVVLVRSTPVAGFTVVDKALTIVSDLGTAFAEIASPVQVLDLAPGKTFALRDCEVHASGPVLVDVRDCAGHVRFDTLLLKRRTVSLPPGPPSLVDSTLNIANCADVAVHRTSIRCDAVSQAGQWGGVAVAIATSHVNLGGCNVIGGIGASGYSTGGSPPQSVLATAGAPAITLDAASTLALEGSSVRGGSGGPGALAVCSPFQPPTRGGDGAPAIECTSPVIVNARDSQLLGGEAGRGGLGFLCGVPPAADGTDGPLTSNVVVVNLPSARRIFAVIEAITREQDSLAITVIAQPGDVATLLMSQQSQLNMVPAVLGDVLVGPTFRRIPLGVVPGSGFISLTLPVGDLAPGVEASRRFMQVYCRDTSGQVHMAGVESVVLLDASF